MMSLVFVDLENWKKRIKIGMSECFFWFFFCKVDLWIWMLFKGGS